MQSCFCMMLIIEKHTQRGSCLRLGFRKQRKHNPNELAENILLIEITNAPNEISQWWRRFETFF